jgi:predicted  nucleic acid-binding Zn-ribbon protein
LVAEENNSLMTLSFNLHRLQQTDTRLLLARARAQIIQEALDNDTDTRDARARAHAAAEAKLRADTALRGAEHETQSARIKIQQVESSLYGGRVINPKELQDLERDIESLKHHLLILEDKELDAMFAAEKAQEVNTATQQRLQEALATAEINKRDLHVEQYKLKAEIESLESERRAIVTGIDEPSLRDYELLLISKRGLAVADLSDDACGACGAQLTPAQRQSVHFADQLIHCPSCGRLLYAG